ncbi:hypothetical protein [Bradyrhizobium sp. STM 3562]|uniref:hypothetical protein n=1 Tax=Bradyrhizobium sp. STM 3562 TaxID=578924 RepID=UPI00388E447D
MTADLAAAVLKAMEGEDTSKDEPQNVSQGVLRSPQNHAGKGVMQVNEDIPAKWKLANPAESS